MKKQKKAPFDLSAHIKKMFPAMENVDEVIAAASVASRKQKERLLPPNPWITPGDAIVSTITIVQLGSLHFCQELLSHPINRDARIEAIESSKKRLTAIFGRVKKKYDPDYTVVVVNGELISSCLEKWKGMDIVEEALAWLHDEFLEFFYFFKSRVFVVPTLQNVFVFPKLGGEKPPEKSRNFRLYTASAPMQDVSAFAEDPPGDVQFIFLDSREKREWRISKTAAEKKLPGTGFLGHEQIEELRILLDEGEYAFRVLAVRDNPWGFPVRLRDFNALFDTMGDKVDVFMFNMCGEDDEDCDYGRLSDDIGIATNAPTDWGHVNEIMLTKRQSSEKRALLTKNIRADASAKKAGGAGEKKAVFAPFLQDPEFRKKFFEKMKTMGGGDGDGDTEKPEKTKIIAPFLQDAEFRKKYFERMEKQGAGGGGGLVDGFMSKLREEEVERMLPGMEAMLERMRNGEDVKGEFLRRFPLREGVRKEDKPVGMLKGILADSSGDG